MHLTFDLPDNLIPSKSEEEIARNLIQAAAMYWLARGEISAEHAKAMTESDVHDESLKDLLMVMPDVGVDADFARS